MHFRLTALASACALALALPAVARADHGEPINDSTVAQYMRIAAEYWGGQEPRCVGPNGQSIPPHAVYGDDPNPAVGAWAEVTGCRIWLDRTHWPAPPSEQYCNLVAHEWGHLLGNEHSADDSSLMWGSWINNVVPGCLAFRSVRPLSTPASKVAAAPMRRKNRRKLREKTRRGRQSCVQVRRVALRRYRKALQRRFRRNPRLITRQLRLRRKALKRQLRHARGKRCVRKHAHRPRKRR